MNDDRDERTRDLASFTNAAGQPHQPAQGHSLVRPTQGLAERVIGAQPVTVYRDETKVLARIKALAAAAGTDWFYRYPVRKRIKDEKTGREDWGTDWIEGPSIKLANDVARIFGNNVNEIRELDVGDAWVFYARFTDIETGFSMERAYRQRKGQTSLKTKDVDRQLDIAYQIGQSKAIRNCIVNSLQIYADFAFEEARNSLVDKIGKDIERYRERTIQGLKNMPVELGRVERMLGRAAKDWLAPDIAKIVAQMKAVADGMTTIDEAFPPIEQEASASRAPESARSAADDPGPGGGGGEQAKPAPAADQSAPQAAEREPGADEGEADQPDPLGLAYVRGADAKQAGHQKRALPPEYRTPNKTREALCWQAGWEGAPMPVFKDQA